MRRATADDIAAIAYHRYAMFRDMGSASADLADELQERTRRYLRQAMPSGEYVGWVAAPAAEPARVVAGAGAQLRRILPRFNDARDRVVEGRQAIVVNVFTEPEFRRQGLARQLMLAVLAWARDERLDSLVLHAAKDGRALYESLGFTQTNEMRYTAGELARWTRPAAAS